MYGWMDGWMDCFIVVYCINTEGMTLTLVIGWNRISLEAKF